MWGWVSGFLNLGNRADLEAVGDWLKLKLLFATSLRSVRVRNRKRIDHLFLRTHAQLVLCKMPMAESSLYKVGEGACVGAMGG